MTTEIPLTQGLVALVDDEDAPRVLAKGSWCAHRTSPTRVYASCKARLPDGRLTTLYMHIFLTGHRGADHINSDGLDNRRSNLREATTAQNGANQRRRRDNTSGFKGVSWDKNRRRWAACIGVSGRLRHLGRYADPEDAARAYDAAAREHFGEFALLNFPDDVADHTRGV